MKYLLAIDPGSQKLGYCVFEYTTNSLHPLEVGTKYLTNVNPEGREVTMSDRLRRASRFIDELCNKYNSQKQLLKKHLLVKIFNQRLL